VTAALIAVFAFLVLIIGGMFLVAWLDDRLCAMRDASDPDNETPPKGYVPRIPTPAPCPICGQPFANGETVSVLKVNGTSMATVHPACRDRILDPDRRKTQRGSWGRA